MSAPKKTTKQEKQRAVALAVLEVIEAHGLAGVTHSKVARKSGVSRAWIYEYIGQDKNAFIEFAADSIAAHLARIKLEIPESKDKLKSQLAEGVHHLFDSVSQDPVVIKIYFRFRGTKNSIGEVIRKNEKQWLVKAAQTAAKNLQLSTAQASLIAELVLTLRLGFAHHIATSEDPKETRARAEIIFDYIHGFVES